MEELDRFVAAQADSHARALAELEAGAKRGHWMWYVFPQIAGLGHSETARRYSIRDAAEARAFLSHPLLGPRLREAAAAVAAWAGRRSAVAMLGTIDAIKLRSSMTLFAAVADDPAPFLAVLDGLYDGERDPATLARL